MTVVQVNKFVLHYSQHFFIKLKIYIACKQNISRPAYLKNRFLTLLYSSTYRFYYFSFIPIAPALLAHSHFHGHNERRGELAAFGLFASTSRQQPTNVLSSSQVSCGSLRPRRTRLVSFSLVRW